MSEKYIGFRSEYEKKYGSEPIAFDAWHSQQRIIEKLQFENDKLKDLCERMYQTLSTCGLHGKIGRDIEEAYEDFKKGKK